MNTILWITMSIGWVLLIIGGYISYKEWRLENEKQKINKILDDKTNWRK